MYSYDILAFFPDQNNSPKTKLFSDMKNIDFSMYSKTNEKSIWITLMIHRHCTEIL